MVFPVILRLFKKRKLFGKTSYKKSERLNYLLCLRDYLADTEEKIINCSVPHRKLQKKFPSKRFSVAKVCKLMQELGYTRKKANKVVVKRNEEKNKEKRKTVVLGIIGLLSSNKIFVYIDKSSFNFHTENAYGYTKKRAFIGHSRSYFNNYIWLSFKKINTYLPISFCNSNNKSCLLQDISREI